MVHGVALVWVLYTCVVFMLPYAFPVTWENFNYAPFAIVLWTAFFIVWWFVHARFWFKGPLRDFEGEEEEDQAVLAHEGEYEDGAEYVSVEEQQELKQAENKQD